MFNRIPNFVLAILSAVLLSASWFSPFTFLIFIAWIPLLIIEDRISENKLKLIGLSYFTFFLWNLLVTWWIYFASFGGAALAIVCNAILMCVVFIIWHRLKQRLNKPWGIWLLIPIWLGFEYGHTLWDLTWTWLTLGNVFAFTHNWVQWYEFTGTSGGSLWILIINILLFQVLKTSTLSLKKVLFPLTTIIIPIIISYSLLYIRGQEKNNASTYNTLIVQPNVDPYNEKFYYSPEIQLQNLLIQIKDKLDSTTDFLVLPETFLTEDYTEGYENETFSIPFLRDSILKFYPNLTIVTGASTFKVFKPGEPLSSTARRNGNSDTYFDYYNTGLQLSLNTPYSYYHKSKLVPGVERMPFPALFKPLESLAIDMGGTMGSLGTQDDRGVFFSHNKQVGIAPVICYESVYSDYVADYIRRGANIIFIITNDGWWENTPGHRQHLAYAKLRAIETRNEIVRCANTGISCFITPLGEVEQATPYWEKATISKKVGVQNNHTFFVKFGDIISYTSSIIAILLFLLSQILRFKKKVA